MAAALVRGSVEDVGVARVHDYVGDAGVFADIERLRPRLAAVGGLVKAAIAARAPERALRSNVDDVGIARVNQDAGDVL